MMLTRKLSKFRVKSDLYFKILYYDIRKLQIYPLFFVAYLLLLKMFLVTPLSNLLCVQRKNNSAIVNPLFTTFFFSYAVILSMLFVHTVAQKFIQNRPYKIYVIPPFKIIKDGIILSGLHLPLHRFSISKLEISPSSYCVFRHYCILSVFVGKCTDQLNRNI